MLRKAAARALWLTKGAALFGGSVVTLALILGVASVALGANGGNFILGRSNVATALTSLAGNVNGSAMQVQNTNAGTNDTALDVRVQPGETPIKINSDTKVANFNADELDGLDSTQIGQQMWAVVNADGSRRRGSGSSVIGIVKYGGPPGHYAVIFDRNVESCAYFATTTDGNGGQIGTSESDFSPNEADVYTYNSSGTPVDLPFHLIVTC